MGENFPGFLQSEASWSCDYGTSIAQVCSSFSNSHLTRQLPASSQVAEHQAQIAQLRAEIDKRQLQLDRKVKKKPLPIPKTLSISNPLPSPPRLVPVPNKKPAYFPTWNETGRGYPQPVSRFPIHERDSGVDSEDNAAYFTCRSTPHYLDEEIVADEPLLQRPLRNIFNWRHRVVSDSLRSRYRVMIMIIHVTFL